MTERTKSIQTASSAVSVSEHVPPAQALLVGGGIAAMAAAAFLIRDGNMRWCDITILEQTDRLGGSLDGAGSASEGYVLRGGRMLESKYLCTFDLFASVPTLDGKSTVTQEIFDWNQTMRTSSKARLVQGGLRETDPRFGLTERQVLNLERLGDPAIRQTVSRYAKLGLCGLLVLSAFNIPALAGPHGGGGGGGGHGGGSGNHGAVEAAAIILGRR